MLPLGPTGRPPTRSGGCDRERRYCARADRDRRSAGLRCRTHRRGSLHPADAPAPAERDADGRARRVASAGRRSRHPPVPEPDRARVPDPERARAGLAPDRGPEARTAGPVRRAPRDELPAAADAERRRRAGRARSRVRGHARGRAGVRRAVASAFRRLATSSGRGHRAVGEREGRPARTPPGRRDPRARDPARRRPVRTRRRPTRSSGFGSASGSGARSRCSSAGSSLARTSAGSSRRSRGSGTRTRGSSSPAGACGGLRTASRPFGRRSMSSRTTFGVASCSPAT